jgi:hypothetical protein
MIQLVTDKNGMQLHIIIKESQTEIGQSSMFSAWPPRHAQPKKNSTKYKIKLHL